MKNTIKLFGTQSRWLCAISLALVIGLSMAACGGGDDDVPVPSGPTGISIEGWTWEGSNDSNNGGKSTITMVQGTGNRLVFTGNLTKGISNGWGGYYGYANMDAKPNNTILTILKNANGFTFKCKGDGKKYWVQVRTSNVTDWDNFQFEFTAPTTEKEIKVLYDELEQGGWGTPVSWNPNTITSIVFVAHTDVTGAGSFNVTLGDIGTYFSF